MDERTLAVCPFCGQPLAQSSGKVNMVAYCDTEDCWMHERKITVVLDDARQVAAWNRRARPADQFAESAKNPTEIADAMKAALLPFARAAQIRLCGGDHWTDDKSIQGTDVAFHITFGDLRAALTAMGNTDGR